jgi:hypothetical protein
VKESVIRKQASKRWTTENQAKSLKPNAPDVFYPRILGKVVIGSITDDFYTTLQNYMGDDLACDGPLLLWLILTHFHISTVTYQDKLKQQIRSRTSSGDPKDDIESYHLWLRQTLDVLTITTQADQHSDLLNPIFTQLLTSKSPRFTRIIEDWHLEYHSEERTFTPTTLALSAEKKCKALRQSNQLYTTADTEPVALEAGVHHMSTGTGKQSHSATASSGSRRGGHQRSQKPQWYHSAPTDATQTCKFEKIAFGTGAPNAGKMANGYVPTRPINIRTTLFVNASLTSNWLSTLHHPLHQRWHTWPLHSRQTTLPSWLLSRFQRNFKLTWPHSSIIPQPEQLNPWIALIGEALSVLPCTYMSYKYDVPIPVFPHSP